MIPAHFMLALGLACAALQARADDDRVALFRNVSGQVGVVRNDATLPASAGMNLLVSDRVVSGAGASAGIAFRDGTRVTVGPSSEVQLRDYVFKPRDAQYAFDLHLVKGSAMYTSGRLAKAAPEAVKISTPTAVVGVRGTRFIVEAD